ncbi:MAG: restriction endonuclease subunit R, partial [Thermoanaerobaculia bacterium]|nr:restriction endonuclease subunit R [Thermoanaerobaculia bacterium]
LCPDLFGPGQDKQCFYLFDYCQNLEYFSQNPETIDGASGDSLGKRLFTARLELIGELDKSSSEALPAGLVREPDATWSDPRTEVELRGVLGEMLQGEVAAMSLDNFVVRPHRRTVERYAKAEAWKVLSAEARTELEVEVAGLPSEAPAEPEEAKRFDLLILRLQLARLRSEPGFERLREQLQQIAGLLEEKSAIPMVRDQMLLIQDLQTEEWWQDVTLPMLEVARRRLRDLVAFIEKRQRKPIYTDFEDEMGAEAEYVLPGLGEGADFAKFRAKVQAFLRKHLDHVAIHKLRTNRALTASDLTELERMLLESGVGASEEIGRAKVESQGLGLFVRSLIGLEREAAKAALGVFLNGKTWSANQIEFVNLIVNHLTEHGVMETARLYESPFTDLTPRGPEGLFSDPQVEALLSVLSSVRANALAA